MSKAVQSGKLARATEITAALAGCHVGLCGFNDVEQQRISSVLSSALALPVPCHEYLLGESARICDVMVVKLSGLGPDALRAAATSPGPILLMGAAETLLEGAGGAHAWPRDFVSEPWSDAELLVRLFRMLSFGCTPDAVVGSSRTEPLVLVVDDDPDHTALVKATLQSAGIDCRVTNNGLEALKMARKLSPDLMMLDINMPKISGFEVLETVRHDPALENTSVMVLTGCNDNLDVMRGSRLHVDDYLSKPVSPIVMLTRVKRLLAANRDNTRNWTRQEGSGAAGGGGRRWNLTGSSLSKAVQRP